MVLEEGQGRPAMEKLSVHWKRIGRQSNPLQEGSAGRAGWLMLKDVLTTIREASDLCPILKTTVGGIVGAMDLVEARQSSVIALIPV